MTDYYCKVCYRTLDRDRDVCFDCARKPSGGRARIAGMLLAAAIPLLGAGVITLNPRICAAAVAVALTAVVVRMTA